MLISMTGFGRSISDISLGRLVVEIQSVNRKFLEIYVSLPKEFSSLEMEVRKQISEEISRGQVNIRVTLSLGSKGVKEALPDGKLLASLKKRWEEISKELKLDPKAIDLPFLIKNLPVNSEIVAPTEKEINELKKGVKKALSELLEMKKGEGNALEKDISFRLLKMEEMVSLIQKKAPETVSKMKEKLAEKMKSVLEPSQELDERLLREVVFFSEKVDITEELIRLKSHFDQFQSILKKKEKALGRKMDFISQEIGREVNTIGAKSLDAKISHFVWEIKSELEKIREQIQNVE